MSHESEKWFQEVFDNPDEFARPHHLFLPWFQMAMLGGRPSHEILDRVVESFKTHRAYKPDYYNDAIGVTQNDARRFRKGASTYLSKITKLPDDAWLKLSLKKDGICNGCAVGNHCYAENYIRDDGKLSSNVAAENNDIEMIAGILDESGFLLGKDYIRRSEQHRVLNFNTHRLVEPEYVTVEVKQANAMVVRLGAIRTIVREGRLKPRF